MKTKFKEKYMTYASNTKVAPTTGTVVEKKEEPKIEYIVKRRWSCGDATLNNLDPYLFELFDMLSIRRRHNTQTEKLFCEAYMKGIKKADGKFVKFNTLKDPKTGEVLAYYYTATKEPVLWSSHVDSVHNGAGYVKVAFDTFLMNTFVDGKGCPLGADDAAGMWLLFQMIRAGIGGTYIFHKAEEVGGVGSRGVAKHHPGFLSNFDYAIAFDRKATHSIITYQGGSRCCSDVFANSLSAVLNDHEGVDYRIDEGGVFTDTKNYINHIAECTNLSCGYQNEHTPEEMLNVRFLIDLKNALVKSFIGGFSRLKKSRKAGDKEPTKWSTRGVYTHNNAVAKPPESSKDWGKRYAEELNKNRKKRSPSGKHDIPFYEDQDLMYPEREQYYSKETKGKGQQPVLPNFLDQLLDKQELEKLFFDMHDLTALELDMQEFDILENPKYLEYEEGVLQDISKISRMSQTELKSFIAKTDLATMSNIIKKLISESGY